MKTETRQKIYDYIQNNSPIWVTELSKKFWLSTQIIHRHILKLLTENLIIKSWTSPKVYYFPASNKKNTKNMLFIWDEKKDVIEDNFIVFSPS